MHAEWKQSIHRQREELARMLREPIEHVAEKISGHWPDKGSIERILLREFSTIPYCSSLYALDTAGRQFSENVGSRGFVPGHLGRDRSQRPYMKEAVPAWGFLLSDAYISLYAQRPSLTALQVVRHEDRVLGYLGADFDLRNLPVTAELYKEPAHWRQVKGDPAIRSQVFQQTRVDSPLDNNIDQAFTILEELITERGVFQAQIHFSSSQATVWTVTDPYRYRILDIDALSDPDICLVYPHQAYASPALIPKNAVAPIFEAFKLLRRADDSIYLRTASINLFNGTISVTFSCDGTHYMHYEEFLEKNAVFWFGAVA